MTDLNIEKLQVASQRNYGLDWPAGLRIASGLNMDPNGIADQLYGTDLNGAAESLYTLIGARSGTFSSVANSWIETADDPSLDIVGDIDIRIEFEYFGSNGQNQALVSKNSGAPNTSYEYRRSLTGIDQFFWSADGTTLPGVVDMATHPGDSKERAIQRVTMDVNDGGGNRVIRHYYSYGNSIDNGPWTPADTDTVVGATTIFSGAAVVRVGNRSSGGNSFNGRIFRAQIRNGIDGTIVANPDLRFLAPGTTSFVDSTGKTWNIGSGVVIS